MLLTILALATGLAALVAGAIDLGYNLAAPLFHAPSMTYGEACGILILVGLLVGIIAILKE